MKETEARGWPIMPRPGVPATFDQSGPHVVMDKSGLRLWAWWDANAERWKSSTQDLPPSMAFEKWTYIGPARPPEQAEGLKEHHPGDASDTA
jgi:hypothetical protein